MEISSGMESRRKRQNSNVIRMSKTIRFDFIRHHPAVGIFTKRIYWIREIEKKLYWKQFHGNELFSAIGVATPLCVGAASLTFCSSCTIGERGDFAESVSSEGPAELPLRSQSGSELPTTMERINNFHLVTRNCVSTAKEH